MKYALILCFAFGFVVYQQSYKTNYGVQKEIEKAKISKVEFDYWESCEKGEKECKPIEFIRSSVKEKWFLKMPCGGTMTTVTLSKEMGFTTEDKVIQKVIVPSADCPPMFELTDLEDGKYYAYMLGCGLGGQIEINLKTN